MLRPISIGKLNISDTAAMLAPYAGSVDVTASLATKLNLSDTSAMLNPYYRSVTALNDLATKEDVANKSTDVTTDGSSDTKYPSVKSVKDYVDASSTGSSTAWPMKLPIVPMRMILLKQT